MKKLILLTSFFISTVALAQLPTNGLILSLPCTGNANDASGNGNNGVVNGATLVMDRSGNANSAYSFNGSSNYIKISGATGMSNNQFSYSVWVKFAALPTSGSGRNIFEIGTNPNVDYGIAVSLNNNSGGYTGWVIGDGNTDGSHTLSANGVLPAINTWYNLILTRSTTTFSLYVNGQLATSTSTQANPYYNSPVDFYIGTRTQLFQYWNGLIDDIAVYNRVLTSTEISGIVTATREEKTLEMGLYPNPGRGNFMVSLSAPMLDATLKVYNQVGQLVLEKKNISGVSMQADISGQPSGVYTVEILQQDGTYNISRFVNE